MRKSRLIRRARLLDMAEPALNASPSTLEPMASMGAPRMGRQVKRAKSI